MERKLTEFIGKNEGRNLIIKEEKNGLTREELERVLKKAADLIRTRVDYKYILLLLFLKRLSDEWEKEFEDYVGKHVKEGLSREEAEEIALHDREAYTIHYPPEYL
jgi:type I restriction enzyme M protein